MWKAVKLIEAASRMVGTRGWEEGETGSPLGRVQSFSAARRRSSRDMLDNVLLTVNGTALCILQCVERVDLRFCVFTPELFLFLCFANGGCSAFPF